LDSSNTQKILGYFIEEAKEHLETLEKGIVDLANTVKDSEQINEMFRAAHSVKGGAAMLGYSSIQKVAHRLEDAFKILRENYVQVDQKLESLLLKGYDLLHDLVEQLQSPLGLEDEKVEAIVAESEPTFTQLQDHLSLLLNPSVHEDLTPASIKDWAAQSRQLLREMLQLFKQEANEASRQKLQKVCHQLAQLAPAETKWQELVKLAQTAIANPKHSYLTLAPVVIKSLKRGSDLIEIGQAEALSLNPELKQLAHSQLPQVLVTLEPRAAADTLSQLFSRQQLSQLVQILQQRV
jgi:chemotaxis protein histidine kinase CheA